MLDKIIAAGSASTDYAAKLRDFSRNVSKERFIRGLGVLLILVALFLQIFAAISPSKTAAAASQNDLIPGGISSKSDAVSNCRDNTNHIDKILDFYGISCSDLAKGAVVSINSRDYNDRFYSAGHTAYGAQFPDETRVNIDNDSNDTIYWRSLHGWDTGNSSTYTALKFTNADGKIFWMLFTCGNLVHINVPNPFKPPPTPCPYNSGIPASSPLCKPPTTPCPYNQAIPASSPACKPCTASSSQVDALACLIYHKKVANITRNIADANNTTASAGDVLTYSLIVSNSGKLTVKGKDFVINDNIADILDYATLTNAGGGTLSADGWLSFPRTNIAPSATVTKTFSVTVKNPIPTTPPSTNNPLDFNDEMTNVFGDTINVKVQPPAGQVIVAQATSLPNTGPGTTMFVYALIAAVAGYFYSNRRLQLKEAKIALDLAGTNEEIPE